MLQDFAADAQVLRIVRGYDPDAQDIRAILVDHVLRCRRIAERLGHLAALVVQHEAVGQHRVIGRPPRVPALSSNEEWNQPRC